MRCSAMRRESVCFSLLAAGLVSAFSGQVPSSFTRRQKDHYQATLSDENSAEWSLNKPPNPNVTDHLVFATVHSLLQRWPNSRMQNGHNIVPGTIPIGTLLFHDSALKELPQGPEWVATDPEHAYFYCRDEHVESQQGCWHLTFMTSRTLNVVYFDGASAVGTPYGAQDTQDLIVWGEIHPEDISSEYLRIQALCEWGNNFGVDGFVRMEMSFEIMLCNFTSSVRIVSSTNLEHVGTREHVLSHWGPVLSEAIVAGSWHNWFPGETRVQLDLARLVSFYDTQLVPSLVDIRAGQEWWEHRVQNVSSKDLSALKSQLEKNLRGRSDSSSGIDWKALLHVIVDRFADRLELTRHFLTSSVTDPQETIDLANKTQTQLRIMLTPYLRLSAVPTNTSDEAALDWTIPIYKDCATTHTSFTEPELGLMTESEKLILRAIRGTTREICRVVTKMWSAGVYVGIDAKLNAKESLDIAEITQLWNSWAEDLDRLMTWLDWSVWVKCNPACRSDEFCHFRLMPPLPLESRRDFLHQVHTNIDGLQGRQASFGVQTMVAGEISGVVTPRPHGKVPPQPICGKRIHAL